MAQILPDWLRSNFSRVLLGEIYPEIRAIVVKYDPIKKTLLTRCYLDREPNEDDLETIRIANTEIFSGVGPNFIADSEAECFFSDKPFKMLDSLDGFVYARRES